MKPVQAAFTRTYNIPFHSNSYSCPKEVSESFRTLTHSCRYTWENHTVQFFYAHGNCDQKAQYIATLLSVLPIKKPLRADILLSPVKKTYPSSKIFDPSNVNTGYASDKKIVVYREEEWFKVFIHECFHYFHFEADLMDTSYTPIILKLFPVLSEVNLYESFCELWARTLNCYLISAYTRIPVEVLLRKEKKHSMRHMVNVLAHMGLTYKDLQHPNSGFTEKTNVLAYVVLTNIVFNNDYLKMHPSIHAEGGAFVRFIETHYRDAKFLRSVEHTVPHITTTMSCNSIDTYF